MDSSLCIGIDVSQDWLDLAAHPTGQPQRFKTTPAGLHFECGWVTMDIVPLIPVVTEKPGAITYGPLAETPIDPDVVMLRVTGRQLMVLSDALPDLSLQGKPQCHIVAMAKEHGIAAASVG